MTRRSGGQSSGDDEVPREGDLPSVAPRDLYQTSDIRFVLLAIGELKPKVDRVITDVAKLEYSVGRLQTMLARVQGFGIAAILLVPLCFGIVWWFIGGQLSDIRDNVINARTPAAQTQIIQPPPPQP
jgi:hypothetical protein